MYCVTASSPSVGSTVVLDVQTDPCITAVIMTPAEFTISQNAGGFLPSITAIEGAQISSLVITAWAVAFAAAAVIRVFQRGNH